VIEFAITTQFSEVPNDHRFIAGDITAVTISSLSFKESHSPQVRVKKTQPGPTRHSDYEFLQGYVSPRGMTGEKVSRDKSFAQSFLCFLLSVSPMFFKPMIHPLGKGVVEIRLSNVSKATIDF
jgi:hypothetical protein